MIGEKKPKQCLKRWRRTFEQFGEEGFYTERRGKGSTGRPSEKALSSDEKLKSGSTYCVFRSGIDIPKKLDELERQALQKKR